jgi:hypothetical protein
VTLTFSGAALNTADFVVKPATVTINSTLATTELQLDATMSGGWTLGSSTALDTLQMWTVFTATTVASIPAKSGDNFDDTNDRLVTSADVGDAAVKYEDGVTDMDNLAVGAKRHMWVRFTTPATTTNANAKSVYMVLTAEVPN